MTINHISEKSGLRIEVAESLYWKCLWLRTAKPDENVQWARLLKDKKYRVRRQISTASVKWSRKLTRREYWVEA